MSEEKELFQEYKGEKIALYGLGTETEKAISVLKFSFEIIGLLDSFRESGELYGQRILSLGQALEAGTRLIIVVARPGSCRAIARRIGDICKANGIALLDIRGKDLLESKQITYDFAGIAGGTRRELYQKIEQAEVISFDLFDTLIMREVLSSADISRLVDARLREKGIVIKDFSAMRLRAEKEMAKYGAPTLEKIYEQILRNTEDVPVSAAKLAETELRIDLETLIPRQAVCDVFAYCIRQNKTVYIVTDTYYRGEQIEEILKKYCLTGYRGLFVSCEHNTGKRQKLFRKLKDREGKKRYLHIGDDPAADIEAASKEGMSTYHIFSAEELLEASGYMGMESYMNHLSERLKIGLFAAKLFNDPFQFEAKERRIHIQDACDIGYLICAPVITDFVFWFREQVKGHGIRNIWFCARDGYLLRQMYRLLDDDTETVYFQTSRTAAVRAGMENEADIAYVDSMKFSGTLEENLEVRFGLKAGQDENCDDRSGKGGRQSDREEGLLKYRESILAKAADEREKYRAYIDTLNVKEGDIAFFDFVAKGTTQMYVQRLTNHHLKGLYFLQLEPEFMSGKGLDIESFYKKEETDTSNIYNSYYVLEPILSAPHPCICGFGDAGRPLFMKETRSGKDIRCFQRVQEGVLHYFRRYLELLPKGADSQNKKLDEVFLGLIHNLEILDEDFLSLIVEDTFFNRMTGMKELL